MTLKRTMIESMWIISASLSLILAFLVVTNQLGISRITSNSMEPTMEVGDLIITSKVNRDEIGAGDIVVLQLPDEPGLKYAHRIQKLEKIESGSLVITKGDANPIPDAWALQITSKQARKVIAVIQTSAIAQQVGEFKKLVRDLLSL